MTINELKHYRVLKSRLKRKEEQLGTGMVYVKDTVTGCTPPSYTAHNVSIEGMAYDYSTIAGLAEISRIQRQITKIESFVNTIPDEHVREAVRLYYIADVIEEFDGEKPTWNLIADKLADGTTAGSIKMELKRFFEKSL